MLGSRRPVNCESQSLLSLGLALTELRDLPEQYSDLGDMLIVKVSHYLVWG